MGSITAEIERVESAAAKAFGFIEIGKLKEAERISKKLRNSFAVLEGERASALIDGYCLLSTKKARAARERCINSISYIWDSADGLYILRHPNPEAHPLCSWFEIGIKGGSPRLGFSDEYYCSFLVLAEEEFEAVHFIEELLGLTSDPQREIALLACRPITIAEDFDRKGVYRCGTFSRSMPKAKFLYL